jgi:hypothetical protein
MRDNSTLTSFEGFFLIEGLESAWSADAIHVECMRRHSTDAPLITATALNLDNIFLVTSLFSGGGWGGTEVGGYEEVEEERVVSCAVSGRRVSE